jgi:hypothetical protein
MLIGMGKTYESRTLGMYGKSGCKMAFVPIHKNAHTWGVEFFSVNYGLTKLENLSADERDSLGHIVFLRDPIERWYSGAVQFLIATYFKDMPDSREVVLDDATLKFMFSAVRLDAHTDIQRRYIMNLNIFHTVFFNTDDDQFYFKLTNWLDIDGYRFNLKKLDKNHISVNPMNQSGDSKLKLRLVQQLKDAAAKNPEYLTNIKNFYRPDFELLEYVSRFNHTKTTHRQLNKSYGNRI